MALSERLQYVLDFNVASGIKSLQDVEKQAEKSLGKPGEKLDQLGTKFTKFGVGALAVAGTVGAGLMKLGQGAADTAASFEALNQVVGETTATSIADWAEDGAQKFGLAKGAIYEAGTTFGMFGKEAGLAGVELEAFIQQHMQLAADWSAFKNVSPEQVIQDVRAAYAGSSETLQKYIGTVNDAAIKQAYFDETGKKVTGTLTGQERIIGINALMFEKGADMMGQFARESDSVAGQQAMFAAELKNLGDEIGQGVIPMMTTLIEVARGAVGAFSALNDATGGNLGLFAGIGTGALAAAGALSLIVGQVIKLRATFASLRLVMATHPLMTLAAVIGGVSIALSAMSDGSNKAKKDVEALSEAMVAAQDPATGLRDFLLAQGDADLFAFIAEGGTNINEMVEALLKGGSAFSDWAYAAEIARAETLALGGELRNADYGLNDIYDAISTQNLGIGEAIELYKNKAAALSTTTAAEEVARKALERSTDARRVDREEGSEYVRFLQNRGAEAQASAEREAAAIEDASDRIERAYSDSQAAAERGLSAISGGYADVSKAAEMSASEIVAAQQKATAAQDAWISKVELLKAAYGEDLIGDVLAYAAEQGPEVGQKLIDGLASGEIKPEQLESMFGDMDTQAQRAGKTAMEVAADAATDEAFLLFPGVGKAAMEQIAAGMEGNSSIVTSAARRLMGAIEAAFRAEAGIPGGGGSGFKR